MSGKQLAVEPSTLGPSIWAVSDGRAGNAAQVRAVIRALSDTRRWMKLAHITGEGHRSEAMTLSPRAPWTWLPTQNWPLLKYAVGAADRTQLTPPWPTLWIAAGRRSAPFTARVRDWSGGNTYCVQILDPKMQSEDFDLVVTPEHDGVSGDNIVRTVGSPSHFSADAIEEAGQVFADLAEDQSPSAIVVLGGDSKTHQFTAEAAERLIRQLTVLAVQGWRLRISASRRTPAPINARFRAMADEIGAQFWAGMEDGPNPYLGWLLFSNAAIVTEDSANMLSDAAWHGLPVHIARLKGHSAKFDRLYQSLIDRGCARWFEGSLHDWNYEPLREADRVADRIVKDLLERYPQPKLPPIEDTTKTPPPDWL